MKKELLLASVVLCSSLITSCGGNNNTSSPSQSTSSSDVQTSTTTSTSSTSNSSQGGTSSSSSSSSTTEPAPSAKTFRIDPSNFNSISALTLSGVVENTQYNDEFTVNAGGSITSTAFKGITKIVAKCYSSYENMEMYSGTSTSGTKINSVKEAGSNSATYTYNFTTPSDSFFFINNQTKNRQHIYFIDIYYTGAEVSGGGSSEPGSHAYTSFESSDIELLNKTFGTTIPFAPCDYYELIPYAADGYVGIQGYFEGVTQAEFNSYKTALTYSYSGSDTDQNGDLWYYYDIDDKTYFDINFSTEDGTNYFNFDIYYEDGTGGGGGGNTGNYWDQVTTNAIYTNEGKGIESLRNENGYATLDFNNGTKVKNLTEQGNYVDGCPTKGDVNVLVIPVEFSDKKATTKQDLSALNFALNGGEGEESLKNGMSVSKFYNESSYGQLNLNFEIMGGGTKWYSPDYTSEFYINQDKSSGDSSTADIDIVDSIMKKYGDEVDCSKFDSDKNGVIDAVVIVPTISINSTSDKSILEWAYRYWCTRDTSYDGVQFNDYLWCPYDFLFETETGYDNGTAPTNNYTLTHEFGHVLGADDYYDSSYSQTATLLDGNDIMDAGFGDHNPYSKFNYGWLSTSRLVTANDSVTLDLNAYENDGDSIIVANNWDETLGCYQEYWVIMYYTKTRINSHSTYAFDEGLVVYHVNAQLIDYTYAGERAIDVYTTNNQDSYYNTGVNLIELVNVSGSGYTLGVGQTSNSNIVDDYGNKIGYTFKLNSMDGSKANITFTANK